VLHAIQMAFGDGKIIAEFKVGDFRKSLTARSSTGWRRSPTSNTKGVAMSNNVRGSVTVINASAGLGEATARFLSAQSPSVVLTRR
jgi:hypothetical protein